MVLVRLMAGQSISSLRSGAQAPVVESVGESARARSDVSKSQSPVAEHDAFTRRHPGRDRLVHRRQVVLRQCAHTTPLPAPVTAAALPFGLSPKPYILPLAERRPAAAALRSPTDPCFDIDVMVASATGRGRA